jgi:hypothetical protein
MKQVYLDLFDIGSAVSFKLLGVYGLPFGMTFRE